jgi:hypothetical protein
MVNSLILWWSTATSIDIEAERTNGYYYLTQTGQQNWRNWEWHSFLMVFARVEVHVSRPPPRKCVFLRMPSKMATVGHVSVLKLKNRNTRLKYITLSAKSHYWWDWDWGFWRQWKVRFLICRESLGDASTIEWLISVQHWTQLTCPCSVE